MFVSRSARMLSGLQCQDQVWIATDLDKSFQSRFKTNSNYMVCKLDSSAIPCSFEKYPTPPKLTLT